jgi:hypothetical protein
VRANLLIACIHGARLMEELSVSEGRIDMMVTEK